LVIVVRHRLTRIVIPHRLSFMHDHLLVLLLRQHYVIASCLGTPEYTQSCDLYLPKSLRGPCKDVRSFIRSIINGRRPVMDIKNCVALVTGANRGLGKAYTDALLAAGAAKVYAGARDPGSIAITDNRVVPLRLDVTHPEQVYDATRACADLTLLINNAGIMKGSPMLAEDSEAAFRAEMEVNVFGVLRMVRAFAPVLANNGGGAIANMLSVVSWFVAPFNATYCASKHAAQALTDGIRIQLKAQGTQVIGVYAGYIDTDMAAGVDQSKTPPSQVAVRTLEGVRTGLDHVLADRRAEEIWLTMRANPAQIAAQMQRLWDERAKIAAA
jgi:NAD(P)-dependent dehydrogenase (short-subunit alcohol dehydrogenase family)